MTKKEQQTTLISHGYELLTDSVQENGHEYPVYKKGNMKNYLHMLGIKQIGIEAVSVEWWDFEKNRKV